MNHTELPIEEHFHEHSTSSGMNLDDMSMLNQVLQQVKGISCVSCPPSYEVAEQSTTE